MRLISQPSYRFNREQAFSVALFGCLVWWKDRESQIINFHSSVWISRSALLIGACPAFEIIFILSKFGPQDFVLSAQIQTANEYRTGFSWKHKLKFVHVSVAPSLPSRCFKSANFEWASVNFAVIEGPVYTIFTFFLIQRNQLLYRSMTDSKFKKKTIVMYKMFWQLSQDQTYICHNPNQ